MMAVGCVMAVCTVCFFRLARVCMVSVMPYGCSFFERFLLMACLCVMVMCHTGDAINAVYDVRYRLRLADDSGRA